FPATYARYLPSGEIAAHCTSPVWVKRSMLIAWKGTLAFLCKRLYRAIPTTTAMTAKAGNAQRRTRRALPIVGATWDTCEDFRLAEDEEATRTEPVSRCRRLRSARMSAAC